MPPARMGKLRPSTTIVGATPVMVLERLATRSVNVYIWEGFSATERGVRSVSVTLSQPATKRRVSAATACRMIFLAAEIRVVCIGRKMSGRTDGTVE